MQYVFQANTPEEFKKELEDLLRHRIRQEESLVHPDLPVKEKMRRVARVFALEELLVDISFATIEPISQ